MSSPMNQPAHASSLTLPQLTSWFALLLALGGCSADTATPITGSGGRADGAPLEGGALVTGGGSGSSGAAGAAGGAGGSGGAAGSGTSGGDGASGSVNDADAMVGHGGSGSGGAQAGNGAPDGGSLIDGAQRPPEGGASTDAADGGTTVERRDASTADRAASPPSGVWNVMPLGDSITASTCYPQLLSQQLRAAGHTNFQFVGTQTTNQGCGGAPGVKTQGHGGYGVTYLPRNSTRATCSKATGCGSFPELQTWSALKPDIVLVHYGTNDVWDGQPPADILAAYVSVMAEFRAQNPNVIFFVSKIIKLNPAGCSACLANSAALAAALTDGWAAANTTATSPVHLVDAYNSGFDPSIAADAADGVHPTPAGAAKIATATAAAIVARGYF